MRMRFSFACVSVNPVQSGPIRSNPVQFLISFEKKNQKKEKNGGGGVE